MEKRCLVYWTSKDNDELALKLAQTDLAITKCVASKGLTLVLTEQSEAFYLTPLKSLQFNEKIFSLSCNKSAIVIITVRGLVFIKATHPDLTSILNYPQRAAVDFELVEDLKNVHAVDCGIGKSHVAVLANSGQLYTWGNNEQGQCGKNSFGLVEATSCFDIKKITCGKHSTAFLTTVGHVYLLGKVFKNQLENSNKASMLPQLERMFIKDFCIGKFVAVLNDRGQVFIFHDFSSALKIPIKYKIQKIACNLKSLYCIENKTFILYEWKFSQDGLKNLSGTAYEIGCTQVFSSSSYDMFALVNKNTATRFLFNLNHELTWAASDKFSVLDLQPLFKRKKFEKLSKKFKLNIDHFTVIKNKAAEVFGSALKKAVKRKFRELWNLSYQRVALRQTLRNRTAERVVLLTEKMVLKALGRVFSEIAKKVEPKKLENPDKYRIFALKIFESSVEKICHKRKSQIFNYLHKKLRKKTPKRSQSELRLISQKDFEFSVKFKANSLIKFCLVVQSVLEKHRTVNTLKGFRAFKSGLYPVSRSSCSMNSTKRLRYSSESFSSTFAISETSKIDNKKSRGKQLSIDFQKMQKFDRKVLIGNRNLLTDRDFKSKNHPKKLDKTFKVFIKKFGKNKEVDRKNKTAKDTKNIKKFEEILKKIVSQRVHAVKQELISHKKQVKIEDWKTRVLQLGCHKLLIGLKKNLKKKFILLTQ